MEDTSMTDGAESSTHTRRVCAWCSDVVGQTYVEMKEHRPASYDGRYFCDYDHAQRWFDEQ